MSQKIFVALVLSLMTALTVVSEPSMTQTLRIDPLLIAEANEVWPLISAEDNRIWPGWDASDTPILFYLPGVQDALINHPHPPTGFVLYDGQVKADAGPIYLRNGETLIEWDGQNTRMDVDGVPSLVVADTLSNLRNDLAMLIRRDDSPEEKIASLDFDFMSSDPYDKLAMIVHEAFHVFQTKMAPEKYANELALATYPVLSIPNTVGQALEGEALVDVLHATHDDDLRAAAVRWLAVRKDRRALLSDSDIAYEDGTEFTEGLAKYTEYRLFQVLQGRSSGATMMWVSGFEGYQDLSAKRERLVRSMLRHMRGEIAVNDDPYGTAPVRMRFYYSGMAIAALLDKIAPGWKTEIFAPGVSLTSLAEAALNPSGEELAKALENARRRADYAELVNSKTKLARDGSDHARRILDTIERGEGVKLTVEYARLSGDPAFAFTPFGITGVDEARTIFGLVPISALFDDGSELVERRATPLLRDTARKSLTLRLAKVTRGEVEELLGSDAFDGMPHCDISLNLADIQVKAKRAILRWGGDELIITLLPEVEA